MATFFCCSSTCNSSGGPDDKFSQCSRCKAAYYCSTPCQRAAWKLHKEVCGGKFTSVWPVELNIEAPSEDAEPEATSSSAPAPPVSDEPTGTDSSDLATRNAEGLQGTEAVPTEVWPPTPPVPRDDVKDAVRRRIPFVVKMQVPVVGDGVMLVTNATRWIKFLLPKGAPAYHPVLEVVRGRQRDGTKGYFWAYAVPKGETDECELRVFLDRPVALEESDQW